MLPGWLKRSVDRPGSAPRGATSARSDQSPDSGAQALLAIAGDRLAKGAFEGAIESYQAFLRLYPRHALALNCLGAAYGNLGRLRLAENCFRRAIQIDPAYAEAYCNVGAALRGQARLAEAQAALLEALRLKPDYPDALTSLGLTLLALGRPTEAKPYFADVLRLQPQRPDAMHGMAQIVRAEGRFAEAETLFKAVLHINANATDALASLPLLRKMTPADRPWLKRAEQLANGGVTPLEETNLRFAIGKYYDDVEDYPRAFDSYQRGNRLLKSTAEPYDREPHAHFVDDMISAYSRDTIARESATPADPVCASTKPVFVVGMPRSGTSLVEQILASHSAARGAGELAFWTAMVQQREAAIRQGPPDRRTRKALARDYLETLSRSGDALRIIDKAPVNTDYLGLIHLVLPNARIIYMRRDPIDTCLSCYFQQFSAAMKFTMDLSDLAHYYRQHRRLVAHWRSALPPEAFLDVPYEELVADQEAWTRRILAFVGLEWNERCLAFHETARVVATASAWQVRQKIYAGSVGRWKHYHQFIEPLLDLRDTAD